MNTRSLSALVGAAVLALAGGWYFGAGTAPTQRKAMDAGQLMFPGLAPQLKDAIAIEVVYQGKPVEVALKDGRWVMVPQGGYPVQAKKLHAMLAALTELRLVEPRTADPEQFARIGVEDPMKLDSKSSLLRILGPGGKPILEVVTGHRRTRTQGKLEEQIYVRRPSENQAWLAEGSLIVDHDASQWLDRDVMGIEPSRVASVTVMRGNNKLVFDRKGDKLTLTQPVDHPALEEYKVDDVGRALDSLTFYEVRPASEPIGERIGKTVYETTDGLTIEANLFKAEKAIWVGFTVSGKAAAEQDAATLSKRLGGWLYELGAWKEKTMAPEIDDLKAAEKPPTDPAKP